MYKIIICSLCYIIEFAGLVDIRNECLCCVLLVSKLCDSNFKTVVNITLHIELTIYLFTAFSVFYNSYYYRGCLNMGTLNPEKAFSAN